MAWISCAGQAEWFQVAQAQDLPIHLLGGFEGWGFWPGQAGLGVLACWGTQRTQTQVGSFVLRDSIIPLWLPSIC